MAKRKKLNKKGKIFFTVIGIVVIAIIALLLCLTLKDKKEPEQKEQPKKETKPKVEEKLKIVDLESDTRPYAVMINNINVARPLQSGLQDAYIVYELIVEGGITRYMALFQDQATARIGSVRSARHYYLDYALENDAIYVHHGQSDQAASDFSRLGIDRIVVNNSTTGWRDTTLNVSSEHTLFTSIEKLNNGLSGLRTKREKDYLLDYSVKSLDLSSKEGSIVANKVSIPYSNYLTTSYEYDSTNKVYNRFVNGSVHKDYVTGSQYTAKNIITYQVNNYDLNDGSGKGRQGIDNIGSGSGYYISEGYAVPIKWSKSSREAQTKYTYTDGTEIKVNDGNTFIQIQPTGQNLTIE